MIAVLDPYTARAAVTICLPVIPLISLKKMIIYKLPFRPHSKYGPDSVVAFDRASTFNGIKGDNVFASLAQLARIGSFFTQASLHGLTSFEILTHQIVSLHLHV
jgi:hypothetical protein